MGLKFGLETIKRGEKYLEPFEFVKFPDVIYTRFALFIRGFTLICRLFAGDQKSRAILS